MFAPTPIRLLPEAVVHKIAAGEVVERPVSVVKELVENALDAGATRIHVSLEQGGGRLIVVSDDGCGIESSQMAMALTRHATSKISRAEDLFSLRSLGFRGEALAAIAAVSRLTLESATEATAPLGYALRTEGGRIEPLREVRMTRGTRVTVEELFCTTPARRKFLKRPETEWSHVYDFLMAMALHYVQVEWKLTHQGKDSLFCPPAQELKTRAFDLFGAEWAQALYPLHVETELMAVHGLIGHPSAAQKSTRYLFLFVNGRLVQDRLLHHAVLSGYQGLLMTRQYPVAVLHLQVAPEIVDVNVHPAKREVRFAQATQMHAWLSQSIRARLEQAPWKKTEGAWRPSAAHATVFGDNPPLRDFGSGGLGERPGLLTGQSPGVQEAQSVLNWTLQERSLPVQAARVGTSAFAELRLIGQLHATYLLCENSTSLFLIDQHAAHERIGFEQLKASYMSGPLVQQRLLNPLTFELPPAEALHLRACLSELEAFGFALDEFGENTFVLKAHAALLQETDWVGLLREIAQQFEEARLQPVQEKLDHLLATLACHRQVRAHQILSMAEMQALLVSLENTPRSYHCPHGRPVMVEVQAKEIEKWFRRIV